MSQNINTQDPDIQPDGVFQEETTVTTSKPKRKRKRSKVLLAGGLVLVGLVAWSFMGSSQNGTTSTVVAPPSINTTAGGTVQETSQAYAESLRQANDQNAEQALTQGQTFIPTPEGILRTVDSTVESLPDPVVDPEPAAEPEAVVTRKRAVVPQLRKVNETPPAQAQQTQAATQNGKQEKENPFVGLIAGQMSVMGRAFAAPESASQMFKTSPSASSVSEDPSVVVSGSEQLAQINAMSDAEVADLAARQAGLSPREATDLIGSDNISGEPQRETEKVHVAAGDIMYGEVVATVNSDAQMPVIVEITTGEYKGGRLKGTFSTDNVSGKLVVSFSQMTNGDVTVPVSALAIDGFTADSSVRSGIERRYLKRYGTVFATTFIEGVAAGLAEPEKTVLTDENGNNQVVEEQRTEEESLWNGINEAIGVVNSDINASRPTGPKIFLHSGYPVGILFVDDLREDPKGEADDKNATLRKQREAYTSEKDEALRAKREREAELSGNVTSSNQGGLRTANDLRNTSVSGQ